jgi:hypothetical protein
VTLRLAFLLVLSFLLAGVACGGGSGQKSATGIVIDVQSSSLTTLDTFSLRTNDGETLVFHVAPDANPDPQEAFVGGHLRSHLVAASQVKIYYREESGDLLAMRIEDILAPSR